MRVFWSFKKITGRMELYSYYRTIGTVNSISDGIEFCLFGNQTHHEMESRKGSLLYSFFKQIINICAIKFLYFYVIKIIHIVQNNLGGQ